MPEVVVWKHPRKNQYTENKYIHINRLKRDAAKNFCKRRKEKLTPTIKQAFKEFGPIQSISDLLRFIRRNNRLFLQAGKFNSPDIISITDIDVAFHLLYKLEKIRIAYSQESQMKPVATILDFKTNWADPYYHIMSSGLRNFLASNYQTDMIQSRLIIENKRNRRAHDAEALVEHIRKQEEQEVIYNRLVNSGTQELSEICCVPDDALNDFKVKLIDEIYENKPITLDTIGKEVVFLSTEKELIVGSLVSFFDNKAIVLAHGSPIGVMQDEIKNIF